MHAGPDRRPSGGRPLEPDRPDPDATSADRGAGSSTAGPGAGSSAAGSGAGSSSAAGENPPGLREQLLRTKDAAVQFARAHVDLAKAEAAEIAAEVKRAAALGGLALACVIILGIFFPIGLILFLGEWLFGSIGWGLLHGTELLLGVAVVAVLAAVRIPGLRNAFLIALVDGVVLAVVLGSNSLNTLWRAIGDTANLGDVAWRPLVVGVLVVAAIGALLGLVFGARAAGLRGAIGAAIAGAVLGALVGALSAVTFGWQAGAGLGVAIGLALWPILSGVAAAHHGVDTDALKARFWPKVTIDTAKETIEWAKARTPLGPTS